MGRCSRSLARLVITLTAVGLPACGGSGATNSVGVGTISIVSITPIAGCAPQSFTITGSGFQTVTGNTVLVKFTATGGATPFGGSAVAVVVGDVLSDTTITGTTPEMQICGVASITFDIDVTLESGVSASASGSSLSVVVTAPTIGSVLPTSVPAAKPTPIVITGTGFTPGPVTIRIQSDNPPGNGNFQDGTADYEDILGTATSTTVSATTPAAKAVFVNFTTNLQLLFPDGCCSPTTGAAFLTFTAPVFTNLVASPIASPVPMGARNTETFTINGSGFTPSPVGLNDVLVQFEQVGGGSPIFKGGTASTETVDGTANAAGTAITGLLPNGTSSRTASNKNITVTVTFRGGSAQQQANAFQYVPPLITTPNFSVNALNPNGGALQTLSGTNFPPLAAYPVNTPVLCRFASTLNGNGPPTGFIFQDGTASTTTVEGSVTAANTVQVLVPKATLCGVLDATATVDIIWPDGTDVLSPSNSHIDYLPPALATASPGGIQNADVPASLFPENNVFSLAGGDPFIVTALPGRDFGAVGSFVEVRFTTAAGALFQGGAQNYDTVVGQVTSSTTITGASPATIGQLSTLSSGRFSATAQVLWEDGTCSDTTPCVFGGTSDRTFVAGAGGVFSINQNGTGVPALIAGGPAPGGTDVAVDARRNRLVSLDTFIFDTAPTMNASPAQPAVFESGIPIPATNVDIALDRHLIWFTQSANGLAAIDENSHSVAALLASLKFVPTPATGTRIFSNNVGGTLVVAFPSTNQIGVFDNSSGAIVSLTSIPAVGLAAWNGVMAIRPGNATPRAYMVYNDPTPIDADQLGTLSFATGTITTTPTVPGQVNLFNVNALAYDAIRNNLFWWHTFPAAIERRDGDTLAPVAAIGFGTNVTSLSVDSSFDDRVYASDNFAGLVFGINGSTLVTVGPGVVVPSAGRSASTSP